MKAVMKVQDSYLITAHLHQCITHWQNKKRQQMAANESAGTTVNREHPWTQFKVLPPEEVKSTTLR